MPVVLRIGAWYYIENYSCLHKTYVPRSYLVLSIDHDRDIVRIMWDDGSHQDISKTSTIVGRSFEGQK